MVNTGSPRWAEKQFRMVAYGMFLMSFSILAFTTHKRYVKDKPLDQRMELAHRVSLGTTPALIVLLGLMMMKAVSKESITAAIRPSVNKLKKVVAELNSVS